MKPLNIRFTDKTKEDISNLSKQLGSTDSRIARAALNIGMQSLRQDIHSKCNPLVIEKWIESNQ